MAAKRATRKKVKKTGRKTPAAKKRPARKQSEPKKHPVKVGPSPDAVKRLRSICLALPETTEVEAWGEPTFRVKGKIFAMHASSGTHHAQENRPAVWILSVSVEQDFVVAQRSDNFRNKKPVACG